VFFGAVFGGRCFWGAVFFWGAVCGERGREAGGGGGGGRVKGGLREGGRGGRRVPQRSRRHAAAMRVRSRETKEAAKKSSALVAASAAFVGTCHRHLSLSVTQTLPAAQSLPVAQCGATHCPAPPSFGEAQRRRFGARASPAACVANCHPQARPSKRSCVFRGAPARVICGGGKAPKCFNAAASAPKTNASPLTAQLPELALGTLTVSAKFLAVDSPVSTRQSPPCGKCPACPSVSLKKVLAAGLMGEWQSSS
jgi:hypothetical protein